MAENEIQGLENAARRIGRMATNTRHAERVMAAAGAYMLGSIEKNFQAQGRPDKWKGLASSTLISRSRLRRDAKGRLRDKRGRYSGGSGRGHQILIDTARLKNSMGFKVFAEPASVHIGTNVKYAARHHFGYEGGEGRGHSHTPARPFLLFQDEDVKHLGKLFEEHIAR